MSYLSHDNRLWAHTWDHDAAANRFRARFTRETRGLSAWLNARAGRLASGFLGLGLTTISPSRMACLRASLCMRRTASVFSRADFAEGFS